jgi:hypothetical protein
LPAPLPSSVSVCSSVSSRRFSTRCAGIILLSVRVHSFRAGDDSWNGRQPLWFSMQQRMLLCGDAPARRGALDLCGGLIFSRRFLAPTSRPKHDSLTHRLHQAAGCCARYRNSRWAPMRRRTADAKQACSARRVVRGCRSWGSLSARLQQCHTGANSAPALLLPRWLRPRTSQTRPVRIEAHTAGHG